MPMHAISYVRFGVFTAMNKNSYQLRYLIKLTLENTTAKVKVNNAYTMEFRVESGVKQDDLLSPTLFSLVIDTVLNNLI